jgi:ferredoxin
MATLNNNHIDKSTPIVGVDKNKCRNCHTCITTCPVKYCNDGSGEYVKVNHSLCIGCGSCLAVCTHNARYPIDDSDSFIEDLKKNKKIIVIVAPAAAASFNNKLLQLNSWLKSIGVTAVFDVSFGAELCTKSYVELLSKKSQKSIICQPCPAIVNYIEIYPNRNKKQKIPEKKHVKLRAEHVRIKHA